MNQENPKRAEIQPSHKRRSRKHDYRHKGTYMITLVVEGRRPLLGKIEENPRPHVVPSPLGSHILNIEFLKMVTEYPNIEVWKKTLMPDHIHMILRMKENLPDGVHMGQVIKGFKIGCTQKYRQITGDHTGALFEEGYNDRILYKYDQLKRWKHYLDDNPRRLLVKRQHKDFFTTIHDYEVAGIKCNVYGNVFLLDIPDIMAVIEHHTEDQEAFNLKFKAWMNCGERGGVLVGTSIGPREKKVMREAMDRGYCLIVLRNNGFPDIHKPSGEMFDACAEGRLLLISPWEYQSQKITVTRQRCLYLNALAEAIAGNKLVNLDSKPQ